MLFAIVVRVRLLNLPLERDEGEYAYAGQLMLQGIPPYKLAYNMKLPGTYAAYAAIMGLFGETIAGIHLGLLAINLATLVLLFFLGWKLMDSRVGGVAAAIYAILSVSPSVLGFAGHATHFVTLAALLGTLLLLRALDRPNSGGLFWAGTSFGMAFLMKQPGAAFILFGGCYLLYSDLRAKRAIRPMMWRAGIYMLGAAIPFALTCLWLAGAGVFDQFWFWTVKYARSYVTTTSWSDGWFIFQHNTREVIATGWPLWLLAAVSLFTPLWNQRARRVLIFTTLLLSFSFLAVCPGLHFRGHYFIVLLPALSIIAGIGVSAAIERTKGVRLLEWPVVILLFLALAYPVWQQATFFFKLVPNDASRSIYSPNPFPESLKLAEYLRSQTGPDDTIAILGSEPQICFYAHRHSATGYIYTYGLMEAQPYALQMQQEMIREIEVAKPAYVLFVNVPYSWLAHSDSEKLILQWFAKYQEEHLEQVGFADIVSPTSTEYHLGDPEGKFTNPQSSFFVTIFKRRGS